MRPVLCKLQRADAEQGCTTTLPLPTSRNGTDETCLCPASFFLCSTPREFAFNLRLPYAPSFPPTGARGCWHHPCLPALLRLHPGPS